MLGKDEYWIPRKRSTLFENPTILHNSQSHQEKFKNKKMMSVGVMLLSQLVVKFQMTAAISCILI